MIYEPITINTVTLDNRLVMAPMATFQIQKTDPLNEATLNYYEERATGGLGLIETEYAYICPQGRAYETQVPIYSDDCIPALTKLVERVKSAGNSRFFVQIAHAGGKSIPANGLPVVAPSAMNYFRDNEGPDALELTFEEISAIRDFFADAALRAKKAGFDGVEIHGAHGYLLSQFLSPITNRRTDIYGGPVENRCRLSCEIITAVRKTVGPDYPISYRLGAVDKPDNGITLDEAVTAARLLEEAGADMISVSGGIGGYIIPGHDGPAYFRKESKAIKSAVNIPVMLTGGITSRELMEELLADGSADLIGIGRPLLKDPLWAAKL